MTTRTHRLGWLGLTASLVFLTGQARAAFLIFDDDTGGNCAAPFSTGWTGISTRAGVTFAMSRSGDKSLYEVDADSGEIVAPVGYTGVNFQSDIDFAPDGTLYVNHFSFAFNGGGLGRLDTATGEFTSIGAFGDAPAGDPAFNGGLTVDPATGTIWASESSGAFGAAFELFKVDPNTGTGYDFVPLTYGGAPAGFGLDSIELTTSGRLFGTGGGFSGGGFFEIDPVTGVVVDFPLAGAPLAGKINGLEESGPDRLLGTTNEGELVAIDLAAGTVTPIGRNAAVYGEWDAAASRCTLIRDLRDNAVLLDRGVGFSCDGHEIIVHRDRRGAVVMAAEDQSLTDCVVHRAGQALRIRGPGAHVTGNVFVGNGTGIVVETESNEIVRNEIVGNARQGLVLLGGPNNAIYRNDLYDNGEFQVVSLDPAEISYQGIGNYWGRTCGRRPLFRPGEDSNAANVVDRFPFTMRVAHIRGRPRPPNCR